MEYLNQHMNIIYLGLCIIISCLTICKFLFYTKEEVNAKLEIMQSHIEDVTKSVTKNYNNLMIRMIEEVGKIKDEIYRDLDEKASKKDMERLESKIDAKADKEDVSKLALKMDRMTDIMIELKTIISIDHENVDKK